jgi:flavin-dependent dehydrogenase
MIQSSANGVLEKLGVGDAGGVRTKLETWTEGGWIVDPGEARNLCVRRSTLDPLLRGTALATPAVDAMLGWRVTTLLTEGGAAAGVEATHTDGSTTTINARLVVGADGRASTIAELAQIPATVAPNARGAYFAYYEGMPLPASLVWLHGTDVAYAFPTDGGLTLLAAFPSHARLDDFKHDREHALEALFEQLPRAPQGGTRVGPVHGRIEIDNVVRPAAVAGLALIGDAALSSDPAVGVGCGWALQSADWLVEETAKGDLDDALKRYRARHHAELGPHQALIAEGSKALPASNTEKMLYAAAAKDAKLAGLFHAYASRNITPREFMSPKTMARAARIYATRRKRAA